MHRAGGRSDALMGRETDCYIAVIDAKSLPQIASNFRALIERPTRREERAFACDTPIDRFTAPERTLKDENWLGSLGSFASNPAVPFKSVAVVVCEQARLSNAALTSTVPLPVPARPI